MRVAMISMHTCPLAMLGGKKSGGMNVYVRDLARCLGHMGVQVDVFTRLQDRCQPQVSEDLGENVRVIHLEAGPFEPLTTTALSDFVPAFAEAVHKFTTDNATERYDLIHSHYWLSGLVAKDLNNLFLEPVPVVQMFHTLGHLKNKYAVDAKDIVSPVRLEAEQNVVTNIADRITAATQSERQELIEHYGADEARIDVIPPGVDLQRFKPTDQTEAKNRIDVDCGDQLVMFVGRIEKLKGVDTLLRAMDILDEKDTEKKRCVVIVGGDPWADNPEPELFRLQELSKELDIEHSVAFVGAKDQYSLNDYYAASDVVVMPSHYESFGMVALEAMASGKPVIASEVGGLAHLVTDGVNGIHVSSRDPQGLADAIDSVLSDASIAHQLSDAAKTEAEKFSWPLIADQVLKVYEKLIS